MPCCLYFSIHPFIQLTVHSVTHKHLVHGRLCPKIKFIIIPSCTQVRSFQRDGMISSTWLGTDTRISLAILIPASIHPILYVLIFPSMNGEKREREKKKSNSPVNFLSDTAKFSWLWRTCPPDSMHHVPKVIRATYLKLTI